MTHAKTYFLLFLVFLLSACSSPNSSSGKVSEVTPINLDSVMYAVFSIDSLPPKIAKSLFPNKYQGSDLQREEIIKCEVILAAYAQEYNRLLGEFPKKYTTINTQDHAKQYIAALTSENRKIVHINAFCHPIKFDDWRKIWVLTERYGRGNCYYNLKIDLQSSKVIEFHMNNIN